LQIGAYRDRAQAESLARRARAEGADARIERSGRSLYHVRVGPYTDRPSAAQAARALRDLGFAPVIVEVKPRSGQSA
jgi:cell division protein FtsN